MFAKYKQLIYQKEFRIKDEKLNESHLEKLYLMAKKINKMHEDYSLTSRDESNVVLTQNLKFQRVIIDLAIVFWRMQRKIKNLDNNENHEQDYRWLYRLVNNGYDILKNNGFEIADHDNELNTGGEAYSVIAYQVEKGLNKERVIETIEPSVYLNDKLIKRAEVIVGQPETD